MSNKWNHIIREKLESHEVSADHLWSNIAHSIPVTSSFWKPWMTNAAIGTVAVATSAIIYFNSTNTIQPVAQSGQQDAPEVALDSASTLNQIIDFPVVQETVAIITGGLPDDIYSGYVWQLPQEKEVVQSEVVQKENSTVSIGEDFNASPINNLTTQRPLEREALTNAFTAVVSNPESLRYFFFGATENADSYAWNFGDGADGQGQSIAHDYSEEGTYTVKYRVERGEEWQTEEKTIEVFRPAKLFPVTAFAPGYDGKNDLFEVLYNARNVSEAVDFKITDINGRLVYQSGGQAVWDGKNLNGELCQPAYYYWLIEFKDIQGNLKSQSGSIRVFAE